MIKTLSRYDFEDEFNSSDTYKNNFSYEGKKALFDYLEEYEEETGEKIEFDLVALCCDYTEYENWDEFIGEYEDYCKEHKITNTEELRDYTQVIPIPETDGFIIQAF